ncbi:MAG: hypothetical protein AAF614_10760 [Chloroflexota bacterium]
MKQNNFLGHWQFDPTQSRYQLGNPPQSGSYTIEEDDQRLVFKMAWTDIGGQEHAAQFHGIPDGKQYPLDDTTVADMVCLTLKDAYTLVSTAYKNGLLILHAQRTLSEDGNTMNIVQSGNTDAGPYANESVYRRLASGH